MNIRVVPQSFHPEDGDNRVFQNGGILPHHYTVSHTRRPWLELLLLLVDVCGCAPCL